jgi:hypothetical protein
MTDPIQEAVGLLARAQTPGMRNEAAIALADHGAKEAIGNITKLLWLPETKGGRGTLLYALAELGADLEPMLLVNLLIGEGAEVQYECLRAIEGGRVTARHELPAQAMRLRAAAGIEKDEDRRDAIEAAAELFEEMAGMKTP